MFNYSVFYCPLKLTETLNKTIHPEMKKGNKKHFCVNTTVQFYSKMFDFCFVSPPQFFSVAKI